MCRMREQFLILLSLILRCKQCEHSIKPRRACAAREGYSSRFARKLGNNLLHERGKRGKRRRGRREKGGSKCNSRREILMSYMQLAILFEPALKIKVW